MESEQKPPVPEETKDKKAKSDELQEDDLKSVAGGVMELAIQANPIPDIPTINRINVQLSSPIIVTKKSSVL